MKSENFVYWLMGYFEISGTEQGLTKEQCEIVKNHLNMVFAHDIDPNLGTEKHVDKLKEIHDKHHNTFRDTKIC